MANSTKPHHLELARKIMDFALDSNLQAGGRLVEKNLAAACNVSRTPVRAALKILEQQALVRKVAGGGYVLIGDPAAGAELAHAGPADTRQNLADEILRDRAGRRLAGKITAGDLMRRYDASRNRVVKTLESLQDQGVVTRAAGQSWIFSRTLEDAAVLQQSFGFRILLEPEAILSRGFRLDANRAAPVRRQTMALLAQAENSIDARAFQKSDIAFHELIARSCPNRFIAQSLLAHHRLRQLPGAISRVNEYRLRQALEEHLKILDHLDKDQHDVAADLMRLHLRISRNRRPGVANRGAPALARPFGVTLEIDGAG